MKFRPFKLRSQFVYAEIVSSDFKGLVVKSLKTIGYVPYVSGKVVKSHLASYPVGYIGAWTNPLISKHLWKILDNFKETTNE
jgi:hypothetical protein